MSDHLAPLTVAAKLLGGIERVALAAGRDPKAAYHWRHPNSSRAPGDLPSPTVMRAVLAYAKARDIPLTADHMLYGAPAAEIEALLSERRAARVAAE